ncbi:uncharacterized protein LOC141916805 [Strix aluco]|uniref:uncharacterized protein LOC141916805 n=1 Tax=Strix aluco TaxID=111821 RepID=UPI003DA3A85C
MSWGAAGGGCVQVFLSELLTGGRAEGRDLAGRRLCSLLVCFRLRRNICSSRSKTPTGACEQHPRNPAAGGSRGRAEGAGGHRATRPQNQRPVGSFTGWHWYCSTKSSLDVAEERRGLRRRLEAQLGVRSVLFPLTTATAQTEDRSSSFFFHAFTLGLRSYRALPVATQPQLLVKAPPRFGPRGVEETGGIRSLSREPQPSSGFSVELP